MASSSSSSGSLRGKTVTADAMHTPRELARHLVEERGADHVFTVKRNQPTLLAQVEARVRESLAPRRLE